MAGGTDPDTRNSRAPGSRLRLALLSIHGLIRGSQLELGRDPDTGGQTLYVTELARALAARPDVDRVDLVTRRIIDPKVDDGYAYRTEALSDKARIIRIDCGPEAYLRKEELWDHLDTFADNYLFFLRQHPDPPHLIHSHYADAGYVGIRVASHLGVPLVHTGHSLGRVKRRRLLASGIGAREIEARYAISRRIEAEETVLASANLVVVSTRQEIDEQYGLYDLFQPEAMRVIPPGTNMERFQPPDGSEEESGIAVELQRFLRDPQKPFVLAVSRPDERKNLGTLVEAYGESEELRNRANLVLVAGTRDRIHDMDNGPARVLVDILLAIDQYDLYGRIAYPKYHTSDDIPLLYRLAAARRGVFINPALTEPFGLTLIEAAASGLPVVATEDGGPRDILANCRHGFLVDPLDKTQIAERLLEVLGDEARWRSLARNGLEGVRKHYSWEAHARLYLREIESILVSAKPRPRPSLARRPILFHDRALFTGLDQNLLGDPESLREFSSVMKNRRNDATFGITTGRRLDSALKVIRKHGIGQPDVLITSVGTEIHYAPTMARDEAWNRHIDHLWTPRALKASLSNIPGLELQPPKEQSRFKVSYYYDPSTAPSPEELVRILRQEDQTVNSFVSFGQYLDLVPIRASKGFALRWVCAHWGIPLERTLAAGGAGTDEDLLRGNTLAVVVGNRHKEELSQLTDLDRIYFSRRSFAAGLLEAMDHYDFFGKCRIPASA